MSLVGTIVHIATGALHCGARRVIGVIIGAQIGDVLSSRIKGRNIIRALAAALALVGIRILLMSF